MPDEHREGSGVLYLGRPNCPTAVYLFGMDRWLDERAASLDSIRVSDSGRGITARESWWRSSNTFAVAISAVRDNKGSYGRGAREHFQMRNDLRGITHFSPTSGATAPIETSPATRSSTPASGRDVRVKRPWHSRGLGFGENATKSIEAASVRDAPQAF